MKKTLRLENLIKKGDDVLRSHKPNTIAIGFPTLDHGMFTSWKTQALNYLSETIGTEHEYYKAFNTSVDRGFESSAEAGVAILKNILEDYTNGYIELEMVQKKPVNYIDTLELLFNKFHNIVKQLRNRYDGRDSFEINDEYDVQDLLHALLTIYFDDIRTEEWTPSYAGKSCRMDFLLKNEKVVIEVKKTRKSLKAKDLGSQLIEDIARYEVHPGCDHLVCFVYDPEGWIANPKGIENDLSNSNSRLKVKVMIRPI